MTTDYSVQVPRTFEAQGENPPVLPYEPQPANASFNPKDLVKHPDWLDASRITYEKNTGTKWSGTDADLAEYGLDQMGWFNYNLPRMAVDAKRITDASPEQKKAFLTLMDIYDKTEISWGGFGRFIKGAALDPTTYVGLSTFGLGAAGGQATKLASKEALKEMLRYGIQAGIEGSILGGTTDLIRQQAEVNAGGKSEISLGEAALSAGIGGVAGSVLGGGLSGAAIGIRKGVPGDVRPSTATKNDTLKAIEEMAGGKYEPQPGAKIGVTDTGLRTFSGELDVHHGYNPGTVYTRELTPEDIAHVKQQHEEQFGSWDTYEPIKDDEEAKKVAHFYIDGYMVPDETPKTFTKDYDPEGLTRYGSVFGDHDTVYLDGDGKWVGNQVERMGFSRAIQAKVHFDNALVINPETFEKVLEKVRPHAENPNEVTGQDIAKWAKSQGHDGLIVTGMDAHTAAHDAPFVKWMDDGAEGEAPKTHDQVFGHDASISQDQVVTFNPDKVTPGERVPVGKDAPKGTVAQQLEGKLKEVTTKEEPKVGNVVLDAIKTLAEHGRPRDQAHEGLITGIEEAKHLLLNMPEEAMKKSIMELRNATVDATQREYLDRTISSAYQTMEARSRIAFEQKLLANANDPSSYELHQEHAQLRSLTDKLKKVDVELSSPLGSSLANRVGDFNTNEMRGITWETFLQARGKDPASATPQEIQWAEAKFYEHYDQWVQKVKGLEEIRQYENDIKNAFLANDLEKASQLQGERDAKIAMLIEETQTKAGILGDAPSKIMRMINEYVVSTVLTTSTLAVNTIPSLMKTLYRPALDAVVTGLDEAALKRMTQTYSALGTSMGVAFRAAKLTFDYEKSMLRTDAGKFLEQEPAIPGAIGRGLRIVPRLLESTDEFFAQMNYRAFVQGHATYEAINQANMQGLKGAEKEAFVKQLVDKANKQSFAPEINVIPVLDTIRQQGIRKGFEGDKLTEWMKAELAKNGDLYKEAVNEAGRRFTDDLLFKRAFSGEGTVSTLAKDYEEFVQKNPWMRIVGQLFFRTPVRVFEEGFRLTAGLNLVTPKFLSDLRGANGAQAQIRAQGEAMLSYGIASAVMLMYAQGAITSGGPSDSKISKELQAAHHDPYVVKIGDHKFDFKNLDPFSTPMKIVANLLDKYHESVFREAQGDNRTDEAKIASAIAIAVLPVAKAVGDANLVEGLSQAFQLATNLMDVEKKESAWERWIGQKAQLAVPSMYSKVFMQGDPVMTDPRTISQYFWSRINPSDPMIPKQYDALGNVRKDDHAIGRLTGIKFWKDTTDPKEKQQVVLDELAKISLSTDAKFAVPYKMDFPGMAGIDLRTVRTSDGKTTLYDRFMEFYRDQKPGEVLYNALKGGSYGTKQDDGTKVQVAHSLLKTMREAAMYKLMSTETGVHQSFIESFHRKGEALTGKRDVLSFPYQ